MRSKIAKLTLIAGSTLVATTMIALIPAAGADDGVEQAKKDVERYSGRKQNGRGRRRRRSPDADKSIVFLSGDEQNDISTSTASYMKRRGKARLKVTVIDGKAARRRGWRE